MEALSDLSIEKAAEMLAVRHTLACRVKRADFDISKILTNLGQGSGGPGASSLENAGWESGRNALIGAGVGGVGGAFGELLSGKRKKRPFSSALQGMMAGGALGGGLTAAYRGLEGANATQPSEAAARIPGLEDQLKVDTALKKDTTATAADLARLKSVPQPPAPAGGDTAGPPAPNDQLDTVFDRYSAIPAAIRSKPSAMLELIAPDAGSWGTYAGGAAGFGSGMAANVLQRRYSAFPLAKSIGDASVIDKALGSKATPAVPATSTLPIPGPPGLPGSPGSHTDVIPGKPSVGEQIIAMDDAKFGRPRPLTYGGQATKMFKGHATPGQVGTLARAGWKQQPWARRGLAPVIGAVFGALLNSQ